MKLYYGTSIIHVGAASFVSYIPILTSYSLPYSPSTLYIMIYPYYLFIISIIYPVPINMNSFSLIESTYSPFPATF